MSEDRSRDIILDLKKTFSDDKKALQDRIVEAETQIRQCTEYIESLSRKDDNDYNVFSPRSASRVYKDQVEEKKREISALEDEIRSLYKKLSNTTKKLDSLSELDPSMLSASREEAIIISSSGKAKLLELQEDDRQRIAADLHDTVLQNLTLVMHNLELSAKFIDYDPIRAKLEIESNRKLVKQSIEDIRGTIFDLRPMQFDDFGFKRTIENQITNYKNRTTMAINSSIDEITDVENIYLITTFRVAQELMINAIKHSDGTVMNIEITRTESGITIRVSDDGHGFVNGVDDLDNHFGLKILKERVEIIGGFVKIISTPNGSMISVDLPISREG